MCSIKGCGRKHNKILHENQKNRSRASSALSNIYTGDSSEMVNQDVNLTAHNEQKNEFIFLATVLLKVEDQGKNLREFIALMDSGSQVSFITEKCCIQDPILL